MAANTGTSWRERALVLSTAAALCAVYFATFFGSEMLRTSRAGIAFADSSHYYQLLVDHHFLGCLEAETPHNVEHRRKTLHHLDYLLIGDAVTRIGSVTGASQASLIHLVTPLLGALNFVLAFAIVRRSSGSALAWPGALLFALAPATWVYAAVPESWPLTGTALLLILWLREGSIAPWKLAPLIGLFALNNFLLLLLVALLKDDRLPFRRQVVQIASLAAIAFAAWVGMLVLFGLLLSPDFMPAQFIDHTIRFKGRIGENLSVFHPARWAYSGVNGWIAPFVLNQQDLNFGRTAVLDSARAFPLGTLAVLAFAILAIATLLNQARLVLAGVRASGWFSQVSGLAVYLLLVFIATGLALYYESFLYAALVVPIFVLYALRALAGMKYGVVLAWAATVIVAMNSAQQMLTFRAGLGL